MNIACPDCGCALRFRALTNGKHVCECITDDCRAVFATVGATEDVAADKFFQKCEQFGHIRSLSEKIAALATENHP